jgi:hypothetical protein
MVALGGPRDFRPVRPPFPPEMQGFFLCFPWINMVFLGQTRALIVFAASWEPRQVSDPGDEAVDPQRQITQALASRVIDRVGEGR